MSDVVAVETAATPPRFAIGGVIATGCALLFRHFLRFLAITVAIGAPVVGLIALLVVLDPASRAGGTGIRVASMPDVDFGVIATWICFVLLFLAGYALLMAALTHGAMQALRGEPVGIGSAIGRGFAVLPKAFGAMLIFFVVLGGLFFPMSWGIVTAITDLSVAWQLSEFINYGRLAQSSGAALLCLVLMALFVVVSWVFVPAIVVERAGPIACYRRSFALTRGRRWAVLAIVILLGLVNVGSSALTAMIQSAGAPAFGEGLDYALTGLLTVLGVTIAAAGYHRLRAEKEGADMAKVFD